MRKPMARAVVALVVAALAALTLASCGDDADIPSNADVDASLPTSVATVQSTSSGIDPTSITVMAGDAVTFANADTKPHRIVADDHSFDTGELQPGDSTLVVFSTAGTVRFTDSLDPTRKGEVKVAASTP